MKVAMVASMGLITLAACTVDTKQPTADTAARVVTSVPDGAGTTPAPQNETPAPSSAPPVQAPDSSTQTEPMAAQWQVTAAGIGNIKAGMSVEQANAALGGALAIPAKLQECDYVRPKTTPKNLAFMVEKNQISRVDVQPGSNISTAAGARIGDTEDKVKSLYAGRVETRPAKYGNGHTLVVTPEDGGNNRIVFETDGRKVTKYRSGRLPAVEYVEGCG